jgi:hypothetical protein
MEFNNETVQGVWEKARATNDMDPNEWRKDECGAWIKYDQYGHQGSDFGWKIESVRPGEHQTLENLRPFQHENSFVLATGQPRCLVTADREGMSPTASIDTPRNKSAG